jgi:hypothetical protein
VKRTNHQNYLALWNTADVTGCRLAPSPSKSVSDMSAINFVEGFEELSARAVSALGARSRKLSGGLNGQSWDG